jgi:DNA processing protein
LEAGGTTSFILPDGILQFKVKNATAEFLEDDNCLVLSEFPPNLPWIARNAMKRNRTILALTSAMILVEAAEDGGTFEAGKEALRLGRPLYVVEYDVMPTNAKGNTYFLRKGARSIRGDFEGEPNLIELIDEVNREENVGPVQRALFT